jgi:hypothetical protein
MDILVLMDCGVEHEMKYLNMGICIKACVNIGKVRPNVLCTVYFGVLPPNWVSIQNPCLTMDRLIIFKAGFSAVF